jgi:hypothetical protein
MGIKEYIVTRREIAFLLIGLGTGLTLAVVVVVQILSHLFIVGYSWDKPIAAIRIVLMIAGLILLLPRKGKRERAKDKRQVEPL